MLFNSSQKPMNNSTLATSSKSNRSIANKQPKVRQNFFIFCWKKISAILIGLWTKTRKFMWVGSTGFIILVVPFVFAYIQQLQNQMMKMMAMQQQNGRGF